MANLSSIEWTEATWNPVTGCSKISEGCENCYAETFAKRLKSMGNHKYRNEFEVTLHPDCLDQPFSWKQQRIIFVCSMSDLFHKDVPLSFIKKIFSVMNSNKRHVFQVLTKRSERLTSIAPELEWTTNIWLGVTVENNRCTYRIEDLKETPAAIKFISFEPLLSSIGDVNLEGIDWVIVGGESGPHARPMEKEWVTGIRDRCLDDDIPFFFKQWGGFPKKKRGRELDDRTWDQMPVVA